MRRWPISVLLLVAAAPAWGREPRRIDVEIDAGDAGQAARQLLGPGADLQETSVRHSLTGTHVRYRTLALDGTPVMGAEAAVHFLGDGRGRRFHARLIDEGGRGLWSLVGRRRIGESAARDAAALAAGGTVRRAEAVAVPAGPYAARPAWRVLVDTQQPRRLLEVLVDADDGSVTVGRDLLLHAEGTGWVYRPNPVTSSGDRTLRAYSDPVNLARFDRQRPGWMTTTTGDLWWIAEHLVGVRHTRLLSRAMIHRLHRVDRRSLDAGLVGYRAR